MNSSNLKRASAAAVEAARRAGALIRRNKTSVKTINFQSRHDIKLELDVRCQKIIEKILLRAFPQSGLLGEEGIAGLADSALRWVVDPIDGTVNFTYGIPHASVSIALQERTGQAGAYSTILGVVYDPFCEELWMAAGDAPARLNGKIIHVSRRKDLAQAIVSIGFSKDAESLRFNLPVFDAMVPRVLKMRMMGSAALALVYVAGGRFDAYIESGIHIWDIAAGGFILERAGGEFWRKPAVGEHKYQMLANNGLLRRKVQRVAEDARRAIAGC
jgi:myo-inositol-1(or 4)-monophosphatase